MGGPEMAPPRRGPDMAAVTGVGRTRVFGWPRVAAWAWLPTLLLITVAVLTVTPVVTALLAGFRDAPPGRPGAISVESIRASFAVMAQPDVWRILWTPAGSPRCAPSSRWPSPRCRPGSSRAPTAPSATRP